MADTDRSGNEPSLKYSKHNTTGQVHRSPPCTLSEPKNKVLESDAAHASRSAQNNKNMNHYHLLDAAADEGSWPYTVMTGQHASIENGMSAVRSFNDDEDRHQCAHACPDRIMAWVSEIQAREHQKSHENSSDNMKRIFKQLRDLEIGGEGRSNVSCDRSSQSHISATQGGRASKELRGVGGWVNQSSHGRGH